MKAIAFILILLPWTFSEILALPAATTRQPRVSRRIPKEAHPSLGPLSLPSDHRGSAGRDGVGPNFVWTEFFTVLADAWTEFFVELVETLVVSTMAFGGAGSFLLVAAVGRVLFRWPASLGSTACFVVPAVVLYLHGMRLIHASGGSLFDNVAESFPLLGAGLLVLGAIGIESIVGLGNTIGNTIWYVISDLASATDLLVHGLARVGTKVLGTIRELVAVVSKNWTHLFRNGMSPWAWAVRNHQATSMDSKDEDGKSPATK